MTGMRSPLRRRPQQLDALASDCSLALDVRVDRGVERIVIEAPEVVGSQGFAHDDTLSYVCSIYNTFQELSCNCKLDFGGCPQRHSKFRFSSKAALGGRLRLEVDDLHCGPPRVRLRPAHAADPRHVDLTVEILG